MPHQNPSKTTSRRDFIKRSSLLFAGGAVGSGLSVARAAHAYGSNEIRIGVVGCGRRGTAAAVQALNTAAAEDGKAKRPVRLVAMADVFPDRLQAAYRAVRGAHRDGVDVPADRRFSGFDACRQLLQCELDLVILAAPPGFRPMHFEAAIRAGKHVFMEPPCATDVSGLRRLMAANEEAKNQRLMVAVGLQRRHERRYQETIARLQDGAIGRLLYTRVYWNGSGVSLQPRRPDRTELEHQIRYWHGFTWLGGGHIVEKHVHNLDASNWLAGGHPIRCHGIGAHDARADDAPSPIRGHQFCEYVYAGGVRMFSQSRRAPGCWNIVAEYAHGTDGSADISGAKIYDRSGALVWHSRAAAGGQQAEQDDLFAALRRGDIYNEADYGATSTMTAILGRLAVASGRRVTWDEAIRSEDSPAAFDRFASLEDEARA